MRNIFRSPKHILCLDGDADTCFMMEKLMQVFGYEVTTARSVIEAQAAIETRKFNLLILDGIGLEWCKRVRANNINTPILFLSGKAYQSDIDNGMHAGAQAYLTKPVEIETLEQTISQFIQ